MGTRFSTVHAGRRIEVEPSGSWTGTTVRLLVDGQEVARAKGGRRVTVRRDGLEVRTWPAWHGESLIRAELVVVGDASTAPIPLDPPPGTWAARREAFARRHPALAAARHPAAGIVKVLLGLIGLSFLFRLVPDISIDLPLPSIDLPSVNLPLPSIDLPALPGWLRAILDSKQYWGPILVGLAYARRNTTDAANGRRPKRTPTPDVPHPAVPGRAGAADRRRDPDAPGRGDRHGTCSGASS